MAKRTLKPAPAKVVRQYALDGKVTLTDAALACVVGKEGGSGLVRGRLNPDLIAAFNAENGDGLVYGGERHKDGSGSQVEGTLIEVPLTKPNARGARLKRPEQVPVAEVRKRAGVEGKTGRLSKASVAKAAESIMTERGWL